MPVCLGRWLPPCTICFSDAQRFCVDCDLTFCTDHFLDYHEAEDKKDHEWRGADTDKVSHPHVCIDQMPSDQSITVLMKRPACLSSWGLLDLSTGYLAGGRGLLHRVPPEGGQEGLQDLQGPLLRQVRDKPTPPESNGRQA